MQELKINDLYHLTWENFHYMILRYRELYITNPLKCSLKTYVLCMCAYKHTYVYIIHKEL